MAAPDVTLTQVEAVNRILRTGLGALPVNSLADPLPAEAVHAREKLDDVMRDLQAEGWNLNYEEDVDLAPDGDGFIYLPSDALACFYRDDHRYTLSIVQRGRRMYDKTNQTFVFDKTLTFQVVKRLPWEDLPYPIQRFAAARAARELAGEMGVAQERLGAAVAAEALAAQALANHEGEEASFSYLDGGTAGRIRTRRRPPFEV